MKTTIYVEGGGNAALLQSELRQGFKALFESAGFRGRLPKVVACGTRNDAFNDFKTAFLAKTNGDVIILLVDSEEIVSASTKWEHVINRDSWDKLDHVTEDNIFLMVVTMESWFLADTDGLAKFFGQGFDAKKLPKNKNLEAIGKKELYDGLENATKKSSKGKYGKGQHSFKILNLLDAKKVKEHGKSSKEFFDYLNKVL